MSYWDKLKKSINGHIKLNKRSLIFVFGLSILIAFWRGFTLNYYTGLKEFHFLHFLIIFLLVFVGGFIGIMFFGKQPTLNNEIKEKSKNKFYFQKGWRAPFYIIGWLGIISVLFWIIRIATFIIREDKNEDFFGEFFHKLIYYFGFLNITLFIIGFIMGALGIWTW